MQPISSLIRVGCYKKWWLAYKSLQSYLWSWSTASSEQYGELEESTKPKTTLTLNLGVYFLFLVFLTSLLQQTNTGINFFLQILLCISLLWQLTLCGFLYHFSSFPLLQHPTSLTMAHYCSPVIGLQGHIAKVQCQGVKKAGSSPGPHTSYLYHFEQHLIQYTPYFSL